MSARAKRPTDDPDERTSVYEPGTRTKVEQPTPTDIAPPPDMVDMALAQRSEPIRAISMKEASAPRPAAKRRELQVQLRSISRPDLPLDLGRLAPPRDPREVRARRLRDLVIWACVAIILACGVTLAIWFAARR